jgi:hypothetical protein
MDTRGYRVPMVANVRHYPRGGLAIFVGIRSPGLPSRTPIIAYWTKRSD